jgi:hypothetical protein
MPANLSPEYRRAEGHFRTAVGPQEKLQALEEMLRVIPKHKGTEGLQADLRARIAKLKKQPVTKAGRSSFTPMVPPEGAGQVVLVGPPNSGKSALVAALTRARPLVADYPLTTHEATPGMMRFENVLIQLVDLPPISPEHVEPWLFDLVRVADLCWVVVDGRWAIEGLEATTAVLTGCGIGLRPAGQPSPCSRSGSFGLSFWLSWLDRPEVAPLFRARRTTRTPMAGPANSTTGAPRLPRGAIQALGIIRVRRSHPVSL